MTVCDLFQTRLSLNIAELVPSTNIFFILLIIIKLCEKAKINIQYKKQHLTFNFVTM